MQCSVITNLCLIVINCFCIFITMFSYVFWRGTAYQVKFRYNRESVNITNDWPSFVQVIKRALSIAKKSAAMMEWS